MNTLFVNISFLSLAGLIFFAAGIAAITWRASNQALRRMLILSILLGLVSSLISLWVFLQPGLFLPVWQQLQPGLALLFVFPSFVTCSRLALHIRKPLWPLAVLWTLWLVASLALFPGLFVSSQILLANLSSGPRQALPTVVLAAGWALFWIQAAADIASANRSPSSILVRKRAQLWVIVWSLAGLGSGLFLLSQIAWGLLALSLALAGATILANAADLPYPRFLARSILSYLILLIPFIMLSWASIALLDHFRAWFSGYGRLVIGVLIAVVWVSSFRVLQRYSPKIVDRLLPATRFDLHHLLRKYSQSISSNHAPGMLANAAIGMLREAIDLQYAHLFEVIYDSNPADGHYLVRDSGGIGQPQNSSIKLNPSSPIAQYFRGNHQPVNAEQIASSAEFLQAQPEEMAWFQDSQVELFIPINTKDDWVGLFALGAKSSGAPYTDDDLTLIITLADQLSLALQNTRLVDSLMRVNNDFRRAYAAMEQSNRQLQQAYTQLEQIDRTKSDFISIASHELRTPLTVMRGYNEMLVEDAEIKSNPYHHKMVKGIQASMDRMQEVIESMLDVATIDTRTLHLHIEQVSINYIVHSVVENFQKALDERKITLISDNLHELPSIQADGDSLYKVFYHLIVNAIKYTPDGGKITCTGLMIAPGEMGLPDGGIEVIISDTGIGIAAENLDLVFKKFYQTGQLSLHSTGKTKFKGAGPGLGLAIAKGIVETHGGKIWAESPGYDEETFPGSKFHIVLPLKSKE